MFLITFDDKLLTKDKYKKKKAANGNTEVL
jgi:hypothetical protein